MNALTVLLFCLVRAVGSKVVELTDNDFDLRLKGRHALVMFYSPNCGHCQRMKPTYESLGNHRAVSGSGVLISRVDCTAGGKTTCGKFGVSGFPTVKFVSRTQPRETVVEYDGSRELDDLLSFVLDNSRPAFAEIPDDKLKTYISNSKLPVLVGFFTNAQSPFYLKLTSIAHEHKFNYLIAISFSEQAAHAHDTKLETLVIFRPKHLISNLEPKTHTCADKNEITTFLKKHKFSLVEYRDRKNIDNFINPLIVAFINIDPFLERADAKRMRSIIVKTAQKNNDLNFAISKKSEFEHFVNDIAPEMAAKDIILVAHDRDENKFVCKTVGKVDDPKSFEGILEQFVADFKKGGILERFIKSQPADTPDDGFVKVLTAHNFNEIVMDSDKDVLVEFYAPWCGHCKKLAPIYQQLATLLKDEPNIVIAKYDATANEAQKHFSVEGFPTIYLAKSGKKTSPISYSGKRETKDMIDWLKKNTKHKISFDGDIPPVKEEL